MSLKSPMKPNKNSKMGNLDIPIIKTQKGSSSSPKKNRRRAPRRNQKMSKIDVLAKMDKGKISRKLNQTAMKINQTIIGKIQNAKENLNQTFNTENMKRRIYRRKIINTIKSGFKRKNNSASRMPALKIPKEVRLGAMLSAKKAPRKTRKSSRNVLKER